MAFRVGDRVAVYGPALLRKMPIGSAASRHVGTVEFTHDDSPHLTVRLDATDESCSVHPKQCRKLKRRAKRWRIWVDCAWDIGDFTRGVVARVYGEEPADLTDVIEFVEVRPKR